MYNFLKGDLVAWLLPVYQVFGQVKSLSSCDHTDVDLYSASAIIIIINDAV